MKQYVKLILAAAMISLTSIAKAESPDEAPNADGRSEAISTNVEYCTTGKCFNHVNDINLTENRYNELLKVTGTLDNRKDLPQSGQPKSTK
jgi:hypothetical protein